MRKTYIWQNHAICGQGDGTCFSHWLIWHLWTDFKHRQNSGKQFQFHVARLFERTLNIIRGISTISKRLPKTYIWQNHAICGQGDGTCFSHWLTGTFGLILNTDKTVGSNFSFMSRDYLNELWISLEASTQFQIIILKTALSSSVQKK